MAKANLIDSFRLLQRAKKAFGMLLLSVLFLGLYFPTLSFGGEAFLWENGEILFLGTLGGDDSTAFDVNNQGEVVGASRTASGYWAAFIWSNGLMTDLGNLGGSHTVAFSINDQSQVVGFSRVGDRNRAFLWENGQINDFVYLPTL